MSKFVFGMGQSLDGYIAANGQTFSSSTAAPDGPPLPPPGLELHRHFNDHVRGLAGILYGRNMYEVMTYWDHEHSDWEEIEKDFAAAWRSKPSWYAVSKQDRTINPELERFMAARMKATTIEVDSGHLSLVSHPDAITKLILAAAGRSSG